MKIEVLQPFKDKVTKKMLKEGDIIETEDKNRANKIINAGYGKRIIEKKEESDTETGGKL